MTPSSTSTLVLVTSTVHPPAAARCPAAPRAGFLGTRCALQSGYPPKRPRWALPLCLGTPLAPSIVNP